MERSCLQEVSKLTDKQLEAAISNERFKLWDFEEEFFCRKIIRMIDEKGYAFMSSYEEIELGTTKYMDIHYHQVTVPVILSLDTRATDPENEVKNSVMVGYDYDKMPRWSYYLDIPKAPSGLFIPTIGSWEQDKDDPSKPYKGKGVSFFFVYTKRWEREDLPTSSYFIYPHDRKGNFYMYELRGDKYHLYREDPNACDFEYNGIKFAEFEIIDKNDFGKVNMILIAEVKKQS